MSDHLFGQCWKCGAALPDSIAFDNRLPFRATCDQCQGDLHCCRNCRYYEVGMPNDCRTPDSDPVADRERFNFCEFFALLGKKVASTPSKDEIARHLFND